MKTFPVSDQMQLFAVAVPGERAASAGTTPPGAQTGKADDKDAQGDFSALFAESMKDGAATPAEAEAPTAEAAATPPGRDPRRETGTENASDGTEAANWMAGLAATMTAPATAPARVSATDDVAAAVSGQKAGGEADATLPAGGATATPAAAPLAMTDPAAAASTPAQGQTAKGVDAGYGGQSSAALQAFWSARTASPQADARTGPATATAAATGPDNGIPAEVLTASAPAIDTSAEPVDEPILPAQTAAAATSATQTVPRAEAGSDASGTNEAPKAAARGEEVAPRQNLDAQAARSEGNAPAVAPANATPATDATERPQADRATSAATAPAAAGAAARTAPARTSEGEAPVFDLVDTSPNLVSVRSLANDAQKVATNTSGATHADAQARQAGAAAEAPAAEPATPPTAQVATQASAATRLSAAARSESMPLKTPATTPQAQTARSAPDTFAVPQQVTADTTMMSEEALQTTPAEKSPEAARLSSRPVARGSLAESRFDAVVAAASSAGAGTEDPAVADADNRATGGNSQPVAAASAVSSPATAAPAAAAPGTAVAAPETASDGEQKQERNRREERIERAESRADIRPDGRGTEHVATARGSETGQSGTQGRPPASETTIASTSETAAAGSVEAGDSFLSVTGLDRSLRTGGAEMTQPSASGANAANSAHHIARQLAQAIPATADQPVEISLSPEELGKVRMTLHSSDTGITVSVHAERPETLDLMRRNIDSLARDFRDMGYSDISFDFANQSGGQQSAQDRGESARAAQEQQGGENARTAAAERPARFDDTSLALQRRGTAAGGLDLRF
ncbi:flagellar hook-length control protein FliK [Rhodobacter maris]|uniref:Flagellar hook-length control protein FliK n=1 Tax=Rhodobacter maris TaxID=446682 RepID=A0A285SKR6_9RHOB|nr:flagellar hook-length control protein FliK [Rhodobacter maris]SOC06743.1 flagellar hook-length control protein FliK [Rhodobacter maris]